MPMSILASVCWKAGSVWLCCGRVCGIPRVLAWSVLGPRWFGARVGVCPRACVLAFVFARVRVCACVRVVVLVWRACSRACVCGCVWGGLALVCGAPLWCVVAVSYSPTPPGVQYHWRGRA